MNRCNLDEDKSKVATNATELKEAGESISNILRWIGIRICWT